MTIDYKFWYITRDDDGFIIEAAIRFSEGAVTTEDETDSNGNTAAVTRYRRSKRLTDSDLGFLGTGFKQEQTGEYCKIYTPADFGDISDNNQLRVFLNGQLALDPARTPHAKQTTLNIEEVE